MKKLYWRPHKVSRIELFFVVVLGLAGLVAVEKWRVDEKQPHYEQKLAAAQLTTQALKIIREERAVRGYRIDPEADPSGSGAIGLLISSVTSNSGDLAAKQTSINPNFAGLMVEYLTEAGCEKGDLVAVGFSGSFPALNMATLAAIETLEVQPVIISSASASQWGANLPDLLWLDMERLLVERGIFHHRSIAASLGAIKDSGTGLSNEGKAQLEAGIRRNGVVQLQTDSLTTSIEERMRIYGERSQGKPYRAFINVGGGSAVVGTHVGKKLFRPGLNRRIPRGAAEVDSVMARFAQQGTPVIHMTKILTLAQKAGFPKTPRKMPLPGNGRVFVRPGYNVWLAGGVVVALISVLFLIIRTDWGFRVLRATRASTPRKPPEQMV